MDPFVDSRDYSDFKDIRDCDASLPRYTSSPRYNSSPFTDPLQETLDTNAQLIPVTRPSALAHQRKHSRNSLIRSAVPDSPLRQAHCERDSSPSLTQIDARPVPMPSTPPSYNIGHSNCQKHVVHPTPLTTTPVKPQKRRYIGDWDFVKTIGAGSMGQVKLAKNRVTGEYCAVKVVPRSHVDHHKRHDKKETDESKDIRTIREAAIGKLLHHRYICQMLEVYPMTNHIYLLFEYVSGGQMLDYIISHGSLKEKQARKFARSIASALDYLHRNSIVHRDLKIENILISKSGDIKIIDFGLSNLFSPDSLLKTFCGSLYFAAPELLNAHPYIGPEVDVWSFGIVLYVLVCGKVPFDDQSMPALHAKIKEGKVDYPSWLSSDCCAILSRMLVVNSRERATLQEIMHHPWMMKGYDKPPESYVPHRTPLHGPLDPAVIKEMSGFEFGSHDEIAARLQTILESPEYQAAVNNWYKLNEGCEKRTRPFSLDFYRRRLAISQELKSYPDPTNAYHPLISVYYLVLEKQKREQQRIAELEKQALFPSMATSSLPSLTLATPSLPLPEVAHSQPEPPSPIQNLGIVDHHHGMGRTRSRTHGASDFVSESVSYSPPERRESRHQSHASEPPLVAVSAAARANASSGGTTLASSILRRFSTRKKAAEKTAPPTIITNTTYEPQVVEPSPTENGDTSNRRKPTGAGAPSSFHPTGRAKSLGHVRRKSSLRYYRDAAGNDTKPHSGEITNESFDDVALENNSSQQDINEANGEMLSIQYPKQVFLKGFFSVQSTSTKSLAFIRSDIIRVLSHLGINYKEIRGGFLCIHKPSLKLEEETIQAFSPPQSPHLATNQQQGHWRKLSFGSGIFGSRRRSVSIVNSQESSSESYNASDVSAESVSGAANGGSDMLGFGSNNSSAVRTPLRFEIYIVKVPLLMSLHGVQFKKLTGNSWQYKSLATKILSELRL